MKEIRIQLKSRENPHEKATEKEDDTIKLSFSSGGAKVSKDKKTA